MKVIMLKDVAGVGVRDSIQNVADGYALNFLIPHGFAQQATTDKIVSLEHRKKLDAASSADKEREYAVAAKKLHGTTITISAKANDRGHLYRQLSSDVIAESIRDSLGIELAGSAISLKEPIKTLGEFEAEVHLGQSHTTFKISAVAAGK
jgi:large subunit ribosomal protein L9